jgi:Kef-type K+ transport system membrane component KefB
MYPVTAICITTMVSKGQPTTYVITFSLSTDLFDIIVLFISERLCHGYFTTLTGKPKMDIVTILVISIATVIPEIVSKEVIKAFESNPPNPII